MENCEKIASIFTDCGGYEIYKEIKDFVPTGNYFVNAPKGDCERAKIGPVSLSEAKEMILSIVF